MIFREGALVLCPKQSSCDMGLLRQRAARNDMGVIAKKIDLIKSINPDWKDLYEEHFGT